MSVKVELGFTEAGNSAPFFTLNDSTKGVLNGTQFVLGGAEVLVDVSEFLESVSISRGKSRELDKFNAGQLSLNFYNNNRAFDPTFEASEYFGQIVPKRQVKVTINEQVSFEGTIEDWNLDYVRGGNSFASAQAFDGFGFLGNVTLPAIEPPVESSSERIVRILDTIEWPDAKRDIDFGGAELGAFPIEAGVGVLEYLQQVSQSEPGEFFVSKNGSLKFVSRNVSFTSDGITFSDNNGESEPGIGYQAIQVVFGSELLFNSATVTSLAGSAVSRNEVSIGLFGERDVERATLLSDESQLDTLAKFIVSRFGEPELRFETVTVDLKTVSEEQRSLLLQAEISDVVEVKYTPNGIPPQIDRYGKIIGLSLGVNPSQEIITFNLSSVAGALLVLDDTVFGRLSLDNSLGW